jgi:hypothetical protein
LKSLNLYSRAASAAMTTLPDFNIDVSTASYPRCLMRGNEAAISLLNPLHVTASCVI